MINYVLTGRLECQIKSLFSLKLKGFLLLFLLTQLLVACGKGSKEQDDPILDNPEQACDGSCVNADSFLQVADVEKIISLAVSEAELRSANATIAVVDRVGNVLAVYQMANANQTITIKSPYPVNGGLENIDFIPATIAAISKAITGAYLSSEGNAFTTRTAGQIIQEHFNPGEIGQPGGPLFGVQFSQLACSDLALSQSDAQLGPKRSPLGLSADPGGFPLYKAGVVIGGVGVIADGVYSFDSQISDVDSDLDELIALAATREFAAPVDHRANRITADGKTLRYSDANKQDLLFQDPPLDLTNQNGQLVTVNGYFNAIQGVQQGIAFLDPASGIRADTEQLFSGNDAFILVDENNQNRFPPTASNNPNGLTQTEVTALLNNALALANKSRAQIRRPLDSQARVTIAVVDSDGVALGLVRTRDAPIFGTDVALQKARTAAFYSNAKAADDLTNAPVVNYLSASLINGAPVIESQINIADYITAARSFLEITTALSDGAFAFSDRAGGNLSRPFFPDGIVQNQPGPFSKIVGEWSPFSTGIQLDLVYNQIINHVAFTAGLAANDVEAGCTGISRTTVNGLVDPIANGIQIFPGSVPIYRGNVLVGGIGVSGDGVDQDDMIAFLGLHNTSVELSATNNNSINNAPIAMRADNIVTHGSRLRFVQCPQTPFLNSNQQNVCDAK